MGNFQSAMDLTEVGMQELAEKLLFNMKMFKLKNNGSQLLSNLPDHAQSAMEPTDQWMVPPEPHALEKSQLLSHITTPSQPLDNHTKTVEISPHPTHPSLTHQHQSPLPFSKPTQHQKPVPTKKPPLPLEADSTTRDTHNQKRSSSLTQRLPELTLPSTPNNEMKILNK